MASALRSFAVAATSRAMHAASRRNSNTWRDAAQQSRDTDEDREDRHHKQRDGERGERRHHGSDKDSDDGHHEVSRPRSRAHTRADSSSSTSTPRNLRRRRRRASHTSATTSSTSTRNRDDDDEFTTLQTRRLAALRDDVFTHANLRRFFRLMDADHSHEVSAAEIQRGLLALGFHQCQDPTVLSRLLTEIDEDRTGSITESEFLSFFSNVTRMDLEAKLSSYARDYVLVRATVYGKSVVAESFVVAHVALDVVLGVILARMGPADHLWLDIIGYAQDVYLSVCNRFALNPDTLTDALVFQSPKLDLSVGLGTEDATTRALIVLHAMKLIRSPIEPDVGSTEWAWYWCRSRATFACTRCFAPCAAASCRCSQHVARRAKATPKEVTPSKRSSTTSPPAVPRRRISAAIQDAVAAGKVAALSDGRAAVRLTRSVSSQDDMGSVMFGDIPQEGSIEEMDQRFLYSRVGAGGEGMRLVSKSRIRDSPPDISMEQVSVVVVDDRIVVTVRGSFVESDETVAPSSLVSPRSLNTTARAITTQPSARNVVARQSATTPPARADPKVHPINTLPSRAAVMGKSAAPPLLRSASASDGAIPISSAGRPSLVAPLRPSLSMRGGFPTGASMLDASAEVGADGSPRKRAPSSYAPGQSTPGMLLGVTSTSPSGWASPPLAGQAGNPTSPTAKRLEIGMSSRSGAIAAAARAAATGTSSPTRDRAPSSLLDASPQVQGSPKRLQPKPPIREDSKDDVAEAVTPYDEHADEVDEVDDEEVEAGEIGAIFRSLRSRLLAGADDVSHLIHGSAKALAVDIVDAVLQNNFGIRDVLKDWEDVLSADIKRFPSGHHTQHLYALERLGKLYNSALDPLSNALDPQNWEGEDDAGEDAPEDGTRTDSAHSPAAGGAAPALARPAARTSMLPVTARGQRSSQQPVPTDSQAVGPRISTAESSSPIKKPSPATGTPFVRGVHRGSTAPPARAVFPLEKQGSDNSLLSSSSGGGPSRLVGRDVSPSASPSSSPTGTVRASSSSPEMLPAAAMSASSSTSAMLIRPNASAPVASPGRHEVDTGRSSRALSTDRSTREAPPPPPRSSMKPVPRPPPRTTLTPRKIDALTDPSAETGRSGRDAGAVSATPAPSPGGMVLAAANLLDDLDSLIQGAPQPGPAVSTPVQPERETSSGGTAAVMPSDKTNRPRLASQEPAASRATTEDSGARTPVRLPPIAGRRISGPDAVPPSVNTLIPPEAVGLDTSSPQRRSGVLPVVRSSSESDSSAEGPHPTPLALGSQPERPAAIAAQRLERLQPTMNGSPGASASQRASGSAGNESPPVGSTRQASTHPPLARSGSEGPGPAVPVHPTSRRTGDTLGHTLTELPLTSRAGARAASGSRAGSIVNSIPTPLMGGGSAPASGMQSARGSFVGVPGGVPALTRGRSQSQLPGIPSSGRPSFHANALNGVPSLAMQLSMTGIDAPATARGSVASPSTLAAVSGVVTSRDSMHAGGAATARPVTQQGRQSILNTQTRSVLGGRPSTQLQDRVLSPLTAKALIPVTAARFFRRHISEFAELADDLNAMCSDLSKQKASVNSLQNQLQSLQNAQMNRTLYALTLITALSVPVTFLTGLWGMNFADMDELIPSEDPSIFRGYKVFWVSIAAVLSTVLFIFWRGGFFSMLR